MQKTKELCNKFTTLHASIALAMRRKKIPQDLRGSDLIRGTVFGLIDHPDYSVEAAVAKAVEMCNLPGRKSTVEEGYLEIMECLETVLREQDFYDDGARFMEDKEIVEKVCLGLVYDIRKECCYAKTMDFLKDNNFKLSALSTEVLKNLVFKKLIAEESTKECMYEYAYRKSFMDDSASRRTVEEIEKVLTEAMEDLVPAGKTPYEVAMEAIKNIHEE